MHAKPDLRVFLKWMIYRSGSVITDVMPLGFHMILTITGEPMEFKDSDKNPISDSATLMLFDGIYFDACSLVDFFDSTGPRSILREVIVGGGYMKLIYDHDANTLKLVTEFEAIRPLTEKEKEILIDDTRGQWSDGVGSSFNSYCWDNHGLFVETYCPANTFEIVESPSD